MSVKMKKIIIILIIVILATTYFLIPLFNKEYIHTLNTVDEYTIGIKEVPPLDIHNIINVIIYSAFIIIIIVSMFVSKRYIKVMYLLILMLFILNCINLWNYGIYVDENNTSITYHLGTLGWVNMPLGFVALLKNMFIRK
jgi:hypothetical protein